MRRHTFLTALLIAVCATGAALLPAPVYAQHHGRGSVVVVGGYFYDPFWGPYPLYPYPYPYPYYPYYARYADRSADVRVMVTPKEAQVFVDGYYMGVVDDFDGIFQRLTLPPGEHEIVVRLEGYRTVHEKLTLAPHTTYKLKYAMETLGPGETMEPIPLPTEPPPTAEGQRPMPPGQPTAGPGPRPRAPRPGQMPPPPPPSQPRSAESGEYGTLAIRAQPAGADITIDGQPWQSSDPDATLLVQLSTGPHRIEIRKDGFRPFSRDIDVRGGGTTPLNVSLSPDRN